jgi:transcriptional regulator with XRE-family HTH domain
MKAEEVGYRIAQARKKQGMTQRELSERLHVSDKAVSKWERGVNYPDISLFDEISITLSFFNPFIFIVIEGI